MPEDQLVRDLHIDKAYDIGRGKPSYGPHYRHYPDIFPVIDRTGRKTCVPVVLRVEELFKKRSADNTVRKLDGCIVLDYCNMEKVFSVRSRHHKAAYQIVRRIEPVLIVQMVPDVHRKPVISSNALISYGRYVRKVVFHGRVKL